jgi:hypothetical protein
MTIGEQYLDDRAAPQPAARAAEAARCVFIVGVSRSGTTLMRRTLNSSDHIAISSENHFMGHLIPSEGMRYRFRKFGDLADDDNVRRLVDHIYSEAFKRGSKLRGVSTQWLWIVRNVDKQEFLRRLLDSDRSDRALFATMMRVYADRKGKPIMGEKTPAHVRYVPTLLAWFPEGRVIHMIRDPRAIFVSELRRRQKEAATAPYRQLKRIPALFRLYILLQTTLAWLESAYLCQRYRARYPANYYPLRFEDLVADPERQIRQVCAFLGVEFQAKMLDQDVVSKGFQAGQSGFDAQAADRWRAHIGGWAGAWLALCFKKYLRQFGYNP